MSLATVPAVLTSCAPLPGVISILCIAVPKGILVEVDFEIFLYKKKSLFPNCTSFSQSIQLSRCIIILIKFIIIIYILVFSSSNVLFV